MKPNFTYTKSKITFLLLAFFMFAGNAYSQATDPFTASKPDLRTCGYTCPSGNVTAKNVYLSATTDDGTPLETIYPSCNAGVTTYKVTIWLNYTQNQNNAIPNARVFATLNINGQPTQINTYIGELASTKGNPAGGKIKLTTETIDWVCGQPLSFTNILVVWKPGNGDTNLTANSNYSCSTYSNSQCEYGESTTITAPLAVQFDFKACKVGTNTTVNFTDKTNGGTAPYKYAWDFNNDGITDSTIANPTYVYTTTSGNTAKLTVTDSKSPTPVSSFYSLDINNPTELTLTETHTNVSCNGSANGSIDLSVSGGTPFTTGSAYTYLWSTGAKTQDISGLPAGNYSVTVTDANGCAKPLSVTITKSANITSSISSQTNVNCFGNSTGSVTVTGANGTAPYTYAKDGTTFTTSGTFGGLAAGPYTITVKDANGCTTTQPVTITGPAAALTSSISSQTNVNCFGNSTGSVTVAGANGTASYTYAKDGTTFTTSGTFGGLAAGTYTITVKDANGCTTTQPVTILDGDRSPPVISNLPGNTTINCPALPSFATPTATDNVDPNPTLTFKDVTTPGSCAGNYSVTRTWTATDSCGNSSTASQTINVQDITAPVIAALPATSTIDCPATPVFAVATATDACGSAFTLTSADVTTNGSCAGSYSVTRTWTATDSCGNSSTASQTINVQDITAPVIAALPATSTIDCPATPVFAVATATDACGSAFTLTSADVTTNGSCAGSYSVTRTWTATDSCGNSSTASQTINVQDITAPVIAALPATSTIDCPATPVFAVATATDACGSAFTLTSADVTTNGSCAGSYSVTRTWTATDSCGNSSTASQTINVQDITAPVIAALPATSTIDCPATPVFAVATATDACGSAFTLTSADVTTNGSCAGSYSVTRTWTATDSCGNSSTASQTINVQDITAPVIAALPATSTIDCPATPVFAVATATDACGSAFTLTSADVTTNGSCAGSYSVTRTWTATDSCGNSSTASQTINVQDISAPVIAALPATSTIDCPATPVFAVATATDACGSAFTLTSADVTTNGSCAGSYSVTRTWTATDSCGNSSTASQTINVQDKTAPVIAALPATSTIDCPATPVFAVATATDACGSAFTLTSADVTTNGSCAGSYSVTRTWTATDSCGNSSTASQTINVQDISAPVIAALPATSTIDCPATPVFAVATATDACGSAFTLTSADVTTNGSCAGSYSVTRTWTATDSCGNSSTASQTINVQDITAPVIAALPATSTIDCPATPVFAVATATDACGSAFTLTSADVTTNGSCAGSYSVTRTWTATDSCGNSSTASQTINVQDITAPVIAALPATSTIDCPATPVFAVATATDACGSAFTLTSADVTTNGSCAGSYSVTRTWTATDSCGNSSTASQTINVQDITAPVIAALPATSTIDCPATPVFAVATATDACGSAFTLTSADVTTNGSCAGSYSVTRTWTATDSCGNSSTASQTINVQDITAPVIAALPATSTIDCPATPVFAVATATDACGSAFTLTSADVTTNGSCAGSYSVTRTWTATDSCGNSSTASQTINVQDITAPVIAALPATSTIDCPATPVFAVATATDACGSAFTLTSADVTTNGSCAGSYSVTRTWTATDSCGNSSTASQTINVQDITAPVIAALPATSTIDCPATPVFAVATATDACGSAFTLTSADVTTNGSCAGSYSVTRTWTATDSCGNSSTASQTINVQDITAPVIAALPATSTIDCPATPVFAVATATDACGSAFTLTSADVTTNGSCAGSYSVTRTWTATDACGNAATASQTINVTDTKAPTTTTQFAAEINVNCSVIPAKPNLVFVDECSTAAPTVVYTENTINTTATSYSIIRKWIVKDACNNTSEFIQAVNVAVTATNITIAEVKSYNIDDVPVPTINLFSLLPQGTPTGGTWFSENSSVTLNGDIVDNSSVSAGDYKFTYTINANACPTVYALTINIDGGLVLPCGTVTVHNAFSPNGDGINEIFTIDNIDDTICYPENTIEIYNRWGVLVFETKGYNNSSNAFNGTSRGRTTISQSSGLPTGTYFYILNYTSVDGNGKIQTNTKDGYLYLTK